MAQIAPLTVLDDIAGERPGDTSALHAPGLMPILTSVR